MPKRPVVETETVVLLNKTQARRMVDQINLHMTDARVLILELQEREGWKALGYDSWRSCVVAEFGHSESRMYQLLDAAKIERNLSTVVGTDEPIAEGTLRAMRGVDDPEEQREVWVDSKQRAAGGKVTSVHVKAAKAKILEKKKAEPSPSLLNRVFDRISDVAGKTFAAEVRGTLKPDEMVQLSKMVDQDILGVKQLMVSGWAFPEAQQEIASRLTPNDTLRDLMSRAVSSGGSYKTEVANFTVAVAGGDSKTSLEQKLKGWPK